MKLTKVEHGPLIQEKLADGWSFRQIAAELGCDKTTVSMFAKIHYPTLRRNPNKLPTMVQSTAMNVLVLDIETRPGTAYVWNTSVPHYTPVDNIIDSTGVMCYAAKWLHRDAVEAVAEWHPGGHDAMIKSIWDLLNRADAVIHFNGKRFDVPHLNREFLMAGLTPPSPYKHIDLLHTSRRQFRFMNNKLENVSRELGIGHKEEHESGIKLWVKCLAGDTDAQKRMIEYNSKDVLLTEQLYYKFRPWIINHPSYAAVLRDEVCPSCGSYDIRHDGTVALRTKVYAKHQCRNCGRWMRGTKCIAGTEISETAQG